MARSQAVGLTIQSMPHILRNDGWPKHCQPCGKKTQSPSTLDPHLFLKLVVSHVINLLPVEPHTICRRQIHQVRPHAQLRAPHPVVVLLNIRTTEYCQIRLASTCKRAERNMGKGKSRALPPQVRCSIIPCCYDIVQAVGAHQRVMATRVRVTCVGHVNVSRV